MKWEKVRLVQVTEYITDGDHQPAPKSEIGISFIKIKDIQNNSISFDNSLFVPAEYYEKLPDNRKPRCNDTLITVVGSYGIPAFVRTNKKFCFERNIALLHPNELINPLFLYYSIKNPMFYKSVDNIANGSAQKLIPLSKLSNLLIPFPPKKLQNRIVNILSAYDDLIENNQRQIKLLEEAAQRLYKEWFVDLRFPGHEHTAIVDGVPEGWKRNNIGDYISYEIGGGWGNEEISNNYDNEAYVIRGTDIYGITHGELKNIPFRYHTMSNLKSRILMENDIVFEVSGGSRTEGVARTVLTTNNMLQYFQKPVMCASFCKLIRPKNNNISQYLFQHFKYLRNEKITEKYDKRSASSIVNYRWKDFLVQEVLLLPSAEILDKYNIIANLLYNKIVNCSIQISELRIARDRLLPKLMSGEMEV